MIETMVAFYEEYGGSEVIQFRECFVPTLKDDEVLVRVRACSVNPLERHFLSGKPYPIRLVSGLLRPKNQRLGRDMAGTIERVGARVQSFTVGDHVYGDVRGTFANHVVCDPRSLVKKPENITFEQAAAIPIAGFTALQGLRDDGGLQEGQSVLINGASGGVGTFAVQIAKAMGARVTGVCSAGKVELARKLGADQVIDYTQQDFRALEARFDVFLDIVGNRPIRDCLRLLTPQGRYVQAGAHKDPQGQLFRLLRLWLLSPLVRHQLRDVSAKSRREDLQVLKTMTEEGALIPVVDRSFAFEALPQALEYLAEGHAKGKVVIRL